MNFGEDHQNVQVAIYWRTVETATDHGLKGRENQTCQKYCYSTSQPHPQMPSDERYNNYNLQTVNGPVRTKADVKTREFRKGVVMITNRCRDNQTSVQNTPQFTL